MNAIRVLSDLAHKTSTGHEITDLKFTGPGLGALGHKTLNGSPGKSIKVRLLSHFTPYCW